MIKFLVDSGSDYTLEEAKEKGIYFAPLSITFSDGTFLDGVEIDRKEFYDRLINKEQFPKTAQPSPQTFLEFFEDAKENGDEVIAITISSGISGTYQSACIAKDMAEYDKIHVIDSKSAIYAIKIMVDYGIELRDQGKSFDVTPPWKRLNMADAVKEITGVDFEKIESDEDARKAAIGYGMDPEEVSGWTRGKIIAEMFEEYCEDVPGYLDGPVFVVGHPVEISPLAKRDPKDPRITRRFEAYINGWEVANAFSELNDPIDQYERFVEQQRQLDTGVDDEAHPMDMDFVNALEVGLPPTGGLGIGIDRVIMLITDAPSIRDIILFPTMKPLDEKGKKADGAEAEKKVIDFSKVEIEPLFEEFVDFDTFSKSDFRAVKVLECTEVPKSKKLLRFVLDDGTPEKRVILSGIKEFYSPEELVGKTCIAIVNLPPREMMGETSNGMLISAVNDYDGGEMLNLLMVDDNIPAGAKLY